MKDWERHKQRVQVIKWYLRIGGRFIKGPFGPLTPSAVNYGRRGWFKGDKIGVASSRGPRL